MLRILSWSSGLGCDKMQSPDYNLFANEKDVASIPSMPVSTYLKRKRSSSIATSTQDQTDTMPDDQQAQITPENHNQDNAQPILVKNHPLTPEASPDTIPSTSSTMNRKVAMLDSFANDADKADAKRQKTRQTISTQLSLEILLKHKELRLIDQELAKCQVALEQLRRCSEIPYPGTQYPSEQVTNGNGLALRRPNHKFPAKSPAPWGVADGPYSRHYAKWLLPDARFDGGEPEPVTPYSATATPINARSTRGSFTDFAAMVGKTSRSQRGSNHMALPAGYGEPKQKPTGPMILKRKSDGKMVKLVCPDCGRHDFGSAQGFINHCRIGHQRNFASHDAAAEACGEVVEYDDKGAIKGVEVDPTPSGTHIHPLIRSARLIPTSALTALPPKGTYVPKSERKEAVTASNPVSSEYLGCGQTPHLSALVKKQGMALNLEDLVVDAKTKVELAESDDDEDEMKIDSPIARNLGRHPQVAGSKQPIKSTGPSNLGRTIHSGKHLAANTHRIGNEGLDVMSNSVHATDFGVHNFSLLPSPTNESNQAPSLIDDDEEMEPQSPPSSDEIDESDVHIHVRDDEHPEDGTEIRASDLQSPPGTCAPTPAPRPRTHARTPSLRSNAATKDDKHVSFEDNNQSTREGNERKRRKLERK